MSKDEKSDSKGSAGEDGGSWGNDKEKNDADYEKNMKESGIDEEDQADLKIILLGDSAVGKSKLVERFMMDQYVPRQLSTYALTMFRKEWEHDETGKKYKIDFWDTAGQERFASMHPSYYYRAHCCILVFDVTRKQTYQHLTDWYKEMRQQTDVPCIVIANKIDIDPRVTNKEFKFAKKNGLGFFFASAADGTNIVQLFDKAIKMALDHKENGGDFISDVADFLHEPSPLDKPDQ